MDREQLALFIFKRLRENGYAMGRRDDRRAPEEIFKRLQPEERIVFLFLARDIIDTLGGRG